jgi:hypothetical protein
VAEPSPKAFQPYRGVQATTDARLRAILEATAKSIQTRVKTMPRGVGGQVRAAQLNMTLAAVNRLLSSMWTGKINPLVARAIEDSFKAAENAVETLTRVAYAALPPAAADELVGSLRASAESGIKSDLARKRRDLSVRVFHQRALDEGRVESVIRQGLISGLSAKELADDVYKYVSPTAPGGSSYSAMRLARTEINNALHERQIQGAQRPGVSAVVWNLSGSHVVPDKCNVYASHNGSGRWPVDKIPDKPHPQCFCYLTYITMEPSEFQAKLEAGGFDEEIARRTRENMARLGQQVGDLKPSGQTKITPGKFKPAKMEIKGTDGKWHKVDSDGFTKVPGGGSRSAGARGGQYSFRDSEGNLIRRASPSEHIEVRDIQPEPPKLKLVPTIVEKDVYKPGAWQRQVGNEKRIQEIEAELLKTMPDDMKSQARELAQKFVEGTVDESDEIFQNGPHEVFFAADLTPDQKKTFLGYVDTMQSKFPAGRNIRIRVGPAKEFGFNVGGETTLGTGYISINEKVLKQKTWPGMPVSSKVSSALYVLAHEWGHAVPSKEEARENHIHDAAIEAGGMTKYGTTGVNGVLVPAEGYAEAFAEWSLTDGKTTNAAAQEYAKHFHWSERFGTH